MKEEKKDISKSKKPSQTCARRWLLTIYPEFLPEYFTPIKDDFVFDEFSFKTALIKQEEFRFCSYCLEKGKEKEHIHIHLYVELFAPQRLSFFKRIFGKEIHADQCRGSFEDVSDYLLHQGLHADKPGKRICYGETGTRAEAGRHDGTFSEKAFALLLEGFSLRDIALEIGAPILPILRNLMLFQGLVNGERQTDEPQRLTSIKEDLTSWKKKQ